LPQLNKQLWHIHSGLADVDVESGVAGLDVENGVQEPDIDRGAQALAVAHTAVFELPGDM